LNIFATDDNYIFASWDLDDKRMIKMILESTQMLCTAVNEHGGKSPYKSTHKGHPCTKWVMESYENFLWLDNYTRALCDRYERTYGKEHKCKKVLYSIKGFGNFPRIPRTAFVNCAANTDKGVNYKHITDTHEAYKRYLIDRWNNDKFAPKWYKYSYDHFKNDLVNPNVPKWVGLDKSGKLFYKGDNYEVLYGFAANIIV